MATALLGLAATLLAEGVTLGALAGPASLVPPAGVEMLVARIVDDEARVLAAGRGLRPGKPLTVRVLDRARLAAERGVLGAGSRTLAEARAEASLRWHMGIGGDPRRTPSAAEAPPPAGVDVTGLYDPIGKRVAIANWIPLEAGRFGRWRDVAQALLDRRFALETFLAPGAGLPRDAAADEGNAHSDGLVARQALLEGDATLQAFDRLSPDGPPPSPVLRNLVEEARRTITDESEPGEPLDLARRQLAQLDGTAFVAAIRARAPWSAVNDVWARPPQSSEQILHLEKYERHEAPDDLSSRLPGELPGGWRATFRDTLGELGARVFLRRAVGDYRAERAAAGWSGDRVTLYRDVRAVPPPAGAADTALAPAPDRDLVVWISTWDDATDAADFADQAAEALSALAGAPLTAAPLPDPRAGRPARPGPRRWRQTDPSGRVFLLEQRGAAVGMMIGAPPEMERAWPALMTKASHAPDPRAARQRQPAGRR